MLTTLPLVATGVTAIEDEVVIEEVIAVADEHLDAWKLLLPQLSRSAAELTRKQLEEIVSCPTTTLFVARVRTAIVGSLTLAVFRIPTGIRAWIEDVVVDESMRGKGIGDRLTNAAIERSRAEGARTVDLTSRPSRDAANRLYLRVGFQKRETNVYRYEN